MTKELGKLMYSIEVSTLNMNINGKLHRTFMWENQQSSWYDASLLWLNEWAKAGWNSIKAYA